MPTIHANSAAEPITADEFARGYYLTDGRRLFRVVSQFTTTLSPYAQLEDCMTLTVDRYTPTELWVMGIRSVPRVG